MYAKRKSIIRLASLLAPLWIAGAAWTLGTADRAFGQEPEPAQPAATEKAFPEQHLTVHLKGLEDLKLVQGEAQGQTQARWSGRIGNTNLHVHFLFMDARRFRFNEPKDVIDIAEYNLVPQDAKDGDPLGQRSFESTEFREGPYGYVPVAWLGHTWDKDETKQTAHRWYLCGLTQSVGYELVATADPALVEADREAIETWLWKAVQYDGPQRVAEWTDEEIDDRWQRDTPDDVFEKGTFVKLRTKYYVIMTNVGKSTTRAFGEKLDENYEKIRAIYPFDDMPAQRLLPIFYFVQKDQYHDWCEKVIGNRMSTSGGVATRDVYSTYHQSVNAPVHIHEATHQIFRNRLFLSGGGSWFQEGVAEYMSALPGDLNVMKSLIAREAYKPFDSFFRTRSLLGDADPNRKSGGSDAGDSYMQAAALIEFVRHSKFGSEKFLDFVHAIGSVPRNDMKAIEAALQRVYGVDIAGFEEEFRNYWKKRKKRKKVKTPKRKKAK